LYESKRKAHRNVHAFPSSVEAEHFAKARTATEEPPDQAPIARPRLGFFGVIDERMDLPLLAELADARPNWQIVMLGPVVKIAPESLPQRPNLHWLGQKSYAELPSYLAGWDVALMPFALNESTRFISPTKTLEYMAARKLIVSTAIRDVVEPYGRMGAVRIADHGTFVQAVEEALSGPREERLRICDEIVAQTSWDTTWRQMSKLIQNVAAAKKTSEGMAEYV
jgi:UDP-galactopyranose mutase